MRKISLWAHHHLWAARLAITFIKLSLALLGIFVGFTLSGIHYYLSPAVFYSSALALLIITFLYPNKKTSTTYFSKKQFYLRQKISDIVAGTCSFILVMAVVNHEYLVITGEPAYASLPSKRIHQKPTAEEILSSLQYRDRSDLKRFEKRILKREFEKQLGIYLTSKLKNDNNKAEKATLIILAIIAAVGLTFLLAALACDISCSGNDGLAILVGIVGFAAIVWLLIIAIRSINKSHKEKVKEAGP
ncbi:MAG: hypothetical protein KGO81_09265 [Bacteroidota bacterium]|nr:hypothetical protein [Bacteroidota bacterium]